jgi:hypothetical protein
MSKFYDKFRQDLQNDYNHNLLQIKRHQELIDEISAEAADQLRIMQKLEINPELQDLINEDIGV